MEFDTLVPRPEELTTGNNTPQEKDKLCSVFWLVFVRLTRCYRNDAGSFRESDLRLSTEIP